MNHIHRYTRVNIAKKGDDPYWVMRCNLPECNSYTPGSSKLSFPLLKDKIARCNKCNEPFILNRRALRFAHPICDDCVEHKDTKKIESADKFFDDLLNEVKSGTNS